LSRVSSFCFTKGISFQRREFAPVAPGQEGPFLCHVFLLTVPFPSPLLRIFPQRALSQILSRALILVLPANFLDPKLLPTCDSLLLSRTLRLTPSFCHRFIPRKNFRLHPSELFSHFTLFFVHLFLLLCSFWGFLGFSPLPLPTNWPQ